LARDRAQSLFQQRLPVCNAGIARQRKAMAEGEPACDIEWRDMNAEPEALADHGIMIDDVREHYVEGEQGRLHVGAAAFAAP
jgi:hypothetical protein